MNEPSKYELGQKIELKIYSNTEADVWDVDHMKCDVKIIDKKVIDEDFRLLDGLERKSQYEYKEVYFLYNFRSLNGIIYHSDNFKLAWFTHIYNNCRFT